MKKHAPTQLLKKVKVILPALLLALASPNLLAGYELRSDTQEFQRKLQTNNGFSEAYIRHVFAQARFKDSIVRIMTPKPKQDNKPSYVPWHQYRKRFVTLCAYHKVSNFGQKMPALWREQRSSLGCQRRL